MSYTGYTTINELPEQIIDNLTTHEYLLITDATTSYKLSISTLNQLLINTSAGTYQNLTNKVIDSVSNFIHANAIHYMATAVEDIPKGSPVKLVKNTTNDIIYVAKATLNTDNIIGICEDGLLSGAQGEIMVVGIIDGINTSTWVEQDILFYQDGVITNHPNKTYRSQIIGYVLNSGVNGKILVTSEASNVIASNVSYENTGTNVDATTVQDAITELSNRVIRTTYKLDIIDDEALLPRDAIGTVVNGIAWVYRDQDLDVITEYTCSMGGGGTKVVFDPNDNLSGYTCVVSYLSKV